MTVTSLQKKLNAFRSLLQKAAERAALLYVLFLFLPGYIFAASPEQLPESLLQASTLPWKISVETINGEKSTLEPWKGKVLLVVNIATQCGLSSQIKELEALFETYKSQGFTVLAFPANDFLNQEPGTNEEIQEACTLRFNVHFPLFAKISVRGDNIHPLYAWLTNKHIHGSMGGGIMWNYTKFLIDRDGHLVARFSPIISPTSQSIKDHIEKCLQSSPEEDLMLQKREEEKISENDSSAYVQ